MSRNWRGEPVLYYTNKARDLCLLSIFLRLRSLGERRVRVPILYSTFKARLEKLGRSLNLMRRDGSVMRLLPSLLRCSIDVFVFILFFIVYFIILFLSRGVILGLFVLREAANRTSVDALGPMVAATVRFLNYVRLQELHCRQTRHSITTIEKHYRPLDLACTSGPSPLIINHFLTYLPCVADPATTTKRTKKMERNLLREPVTSFSIFLPDYSTHT